MAKLKYTLQNDILFKMLFVKYPKLLKRLVAKILRIDYKSITKFKITNAEIPPETVGSKFCRLDVNMTVNGQHVDLELQVDNEGNYPERMMYYWAREYSAALLEGEDYINLPRTVIIGIVYFKMFESVEYHSEYQALEVKRHTALTDKFNIHIFELVKLPKEISKKDELELWLKLFKARTEEELKQIEETGVGVMKDAIGAYKHISAAPEFLELERMRSKARHDEAQALSHERLKTQKKWEGVIAKKDAIIADKDAALADKEAVLADKEAIIAELRARLGEDK